MKKAVCALALVALFGLAVPSAAQARETRVSKADVTEHGPRRHRGPRRGGYWRGGAVYGPRYYRPGPRYYAPPPRPVYVVPARPVVVYPAPYYGGTAVCR